jgi:hypothetical protein
MKRARYMSLAKRLLHMIDTNTVMAQRQAFDVFGGNVRISSALRTIEEMKATMSLRFMES